MPPLAPLRILIFGLNYSPELTGIGKYTGEMADWLAARGHQVRVVTSPPYYPGWQVHSVYAGRGYQQEGGAPRESGAATPQVFRCPIYVPAAEAANGVRRILHLLSFAVSGTPVMLREAFARPHIVLTVEPTFFCAPTALAVGAMAGAPVWLHVQDLEVDAAFDLGLLPAGGLIHGFATWFEKLLTRAFYRVSSISERMLERCLTKGVDPRRAVLFPNWVDTQLIYPEPFGRPNLLRQQHGLAGKIVFLYSGNMGNKQGLELLAPLARAFLQNPAVHFLFCGDGSYRTTLQTEVAGMRNVTLLPLQPLERLNELLNAADVHLLPQRANTADLVMPSRLTGMLASGRPVLACAEPGTQVAAVLQARPDGNGPCGVVVPVGDLAALVHAVAELAADASLRESMGLAARGYAVRHLDRDAILLHFEEDVHEAVMEFRQLSVRAR